MSEVPVGFTKLEGKERKFNEDLLNLIKKAAEDGLTPKIVISILGNALSRVIVLCYKKERLDTVVNLTKQDLDNTVSYYKDKYGQDEDNDE